MNIFVIASFSQTNKIDSVSLNNGQVLTGQIFKYIPNEYLKIQTSDGNFFFTNNDIRKISIHSVENFQQGFDISNQVVIKPQSSDQLNSRSTKPTNLSQIDETSFVSDGLPQDLFFIQGGADGLTIYSLAEIDSYNKLQAIYCHRFWNKTAMGIGYAYRSMEHDDEYHNFFIDVRSIKKIRQNELGSFAFDLGFGLSIFNPLSIYANGSYNYGMRLYQSLFWTIGVDLNFQSNGNRIYETYSNYINGYSSGGTRFAGSENSFTFGFTTGIMF